MKTHMSKFHGVGVVWFHGILKKEDSPGVMRAKKRETMLKNKAEAEAEATVAARLPQPPLPPLPHSLAAVPTGAVRYGVPAAFKGQIDANGEIVGRVAGNGEYQLAMFAYCGYNADKLGI